MGVQTFRVGGVDLTIEESALRERVSYDGEPVSDVSTLRPALSRVHAFTAGSPLASFEVRTYGYSGSVVIRDGRLLASRRPGWVIGAMFAALGLVNWVDFAYDGGRLDLASAVVFTVAGSVGLVPYVLWERVKRRWPLDASASSKDVH